MTRYNINKRDYRRRVRHLFYLVLFAVGLILIAFGLNIFRDRYHTAHSGIPSAQNVATTTATKPSEQQIPVTYSVPADQPLSISLPTIQTTGFIQKVGVDKANQMVAPSNINMAGWYVGGAKPGDSGLSIIDGHVTGLYSNGIFYRLDNLKPGDSFTVTYGNHSTKNFQVKHVSTVSVTDATTALFTRDNTLARQLNLITCGGTYVKASKSYDGRVIVVAEGI